MIQRPCRPHPWQWPTKGDSSLVCSRCGRVLPFSVLMTEHHRRRGIIRTAFRRLDKERGEQFASALADTMNHYLKQSTRKEKAQ